MNLLLAALSLAVGLFQPYQLRTYDGQTHDAEVAMLGDLALIRLKSTSASPGSPVVFLSPGPGIASSVLARVPVYYALFDRLRASADVILLDARGEGMSRPRLDDCPASPMPEQPFESEKALAAAFAASVKHCADYWRAHGVDAASFTTGARADDVDAVRKALGARRISIVAFSYGTEVALNLLRRYPRSIDRAVLAATNDQPVSPNVFDADIYKLGVLANTDLTAQIAQLMADLDKRPREVTIDGRTFRVGKATVQSLLTAKLPDARGASMIPALVESMNRGDNTILQAFVKELAPALTKGLTLVGRSIDCSTPVSEGTRRALVAEARMSLVGNARNLARGPEVCSMFRTSTNAPPPLHSTTPVLFISGTLDANAPPFVAERIRWGLPNAKHIVVVNGFHETLPSGDVQSVAADFIAGKDIGWPAIAFAPPTFLTVEEAKLKSESRNR